ncbi:hypothetical protein Q0Z83_007020 [Actinoplanes sichuanensis]|nr:hypothetical protein [Actinoplanes sichuanensis]BEL02511.1 hypothetical protein Q0Z83_007020 [Actinoplanes sichuanensis]
MPKPGTPSGAGREKIGFPLSRPEPVEADRPYMDADGTLHNLRPIGRLETSGPDTEPRRYADTAFGGGWFVSKAGGSKAAGDGEPDAGGTATGGAASSDTASSDTATGGTAAGRDGASGVQGGSGRHASKAGADAEPAGGEMGDGRAAAAAGKAGEARHQAADGRATATGGQSATTDGETTTDGHPKAAGEQRATAEGPAGANGERRTGNGTAAERRAETDRAGEPQAGDGAGAERQAETDSGTGRQAGSGAGADGQAAAKLGAAGEQPAGGAADAARPKQQNGARAASDVPRGPDLAPHLPLTAAELSAIRWRLDGATLREVVDNRDALRALGERLDGPLTDEADNIVKAGLLSVRAEVYRLLGELGMAAAASRLALAHAESAHDLQSMVIAQAELAHVLRLRGDYMEADRLFQKAVEAEVSPAVRSVVHENAGRSCFDQGRHMEALDHFARAVRLGAPEDTDLVERIGVCLEAVYIHVLRDGWGPYPRRSPEILTPLGGKPAADGDQPG